MKPVYPLLIASLLSVATPQARSQTHEPIRNAAKDLTSHCGNDIQKLCNGKTGDAAKACLAGKMDKLSPECRSAVSNAPPPSG